MNRILLTGGSGLLGKALISKLIDSHYEVFCLTKSVQSSHSLGLDYIPIDLSTNWHKDDLPSNISAIIHLAQSRHFREFPQHSDDVFRVNIESTFKLLNFARETGVQKFVYASSGGVYQPGSLLNENAPLLPLQANLGFYAGSKMCSEILVQAYSNYFPITTLRPFFIYGKEQQRTMLIPRLFDSVKNNTPIVLNGENGITINPIHVSDASDALLCALSLEDSWTINIAGPELLSIRDICDCFGNYLGMEPKYSLTENSSSDLVGDISVMKELLMNPQRKLADHLEDIEN